MMLDSPLRRSQLFNGLSRAMTVPGDSPEDAIAAENLLVALIAQWLTAQVSAAANAPAVLIAGADEVAQPHLERLADACESRGVPRPVDSALADLRASSAPRRLITLVLAPPGPIWPIEARGDLPCCMLGFLK